MKNLLKNRTFIAAMTSILVGAVATVILSRKTTKDASQDILEMEETGPEL